MATARTWKSAQTYTSPTTQKVHPLAKAAANRGTGGTYAPLSGRTGTNVQSWRPTTRPLLEPQTSGVVTKPGVATWLPNTRPLLEPRPSGDHKEQPQVIGLRPGVVTTKPGQGPAQPKPVQPKPVQPSGPRRPGSRLPNGNIFVGWKMMPNGKRVAIQRFANGATGIYAPKQQSGGGARPNTGGGASTPQPQTPVDFWGDGTWSDTNDAYDLSKGTVRGIVRDFSSPSGWSAVDEYGRRRPVTDKAAAVKAGWKVLTKDQILSLNPAFYGGNAAGGGGNGQGQGTGNPWLDSLLQQQQSLFPGLGTLTTNPQVQASGLLDVPYLQDHSNALAAAQAAMTPLQSEIQALTAVNPVTGKTLYQELIANAQRELQGGQSDALARAAAGGTLSSGMTNGTLAGLGAGYMQQAQQLGSQYGDPRLNMLQQNVLQEQQNYAMQLNNALIAAYQRNMEQANQALPSDLAFSILGQGS